MNPTDSQKVDQGKIKTETIIEYEIKQAQQNSNFVKFSLSSFCCSLGRNLGSLLFLLFSLFLNFAHILRNGWEFSGGGSNKRSNDSSRLHSVAMLLMYQKFYHQFVG